MSGKAQFRSAQGCCICGTKSSSSRFTPSKRFHQHFERCFGPQARTREGDLCNACVLCIKRWLKQPYVRRELHRFAPVIDSKRGTGPKHMKQITKQRKRREARLHMSHAKNQGSTSSLYCEDTSSLSTHHHYHNPHYHYTPSGNTISSSANATTLAAAMDHSTLNYMSIKDNVSGTGCNTPPTSSSGSGKVSASSSYQPPANSTRSAIAAQQQQQLQVSQQHSLDLNDSGTHMAGSLMGNHLAASGFRAPDPPQAPPKRMNRYRRQSQLTPVKLPSSEEEVDQLLREIMAQNSEAVNFDCREMHMAFQNRIRLRSRTVATSLPSSGCSSSTGSGSLNSISSLSTSPSATNHSREGSTLGYSPVSDNGGSCVGAFGRLVNGCGSSAHTGGSSIVNSGGLGGTEPPGAGSLPSHQGTRTFL